MRHEIQTCMARDGGGHEHVSGSGVWSTADMFKHESQRGNGSARILFGSCLIVVSTNIIFIILSSGNIVIN